MSKEFLRLQPLFADLSEDDLDWLSAQVEPLTIEAGTNLMEEGESGDAAYIVVDADLEVVKRSDNQDILIAVREPGQVVGEMALLDRAPRSATVRALREGHVLKIRGETFKQLLAHSPSAALSMLRTVTQRLRQNEAMLRQNEKMAALGTMAAGLAHELNNPAAAVRRSASQVRAALTQWDELTTRLGRATLDAEQIRMLDSLKLQIESPHTQASNLDPMTQSDRESKLQSWLEARGMQDAWELVPPLISAGWEVSSLGKLGDVFTAETSSVVLRWLAAGNTVFALLDEVGVGTERISEIVRSVKAYSYLDQGPVQQVDLREGLENTLVILRHKMKDGIVIRRDYAADLPQIEAHGSELNQVWTNILDNAVDAMQGHGELALRTHRQGGNVVIEIQDNGPGIPPQIQERIFEPFFTTKPPGQGTGLGLHIAYTVINNHHGQLHVTSEPGNTCFRVTLPIQMPR